MSRATNPTPKSSPSTTHSNAWRRTIRGKLASSSCGSSEACRWRRRHRLSACHRGPRRTIGRSHAPGCTESSRESETAMNMDHWRQLDQVFVEALQLPPEARTPFVERACGEDDAL